MLSNAVKHREWYGVYHGVVHTNTDPKGLFRIKVKVPQVLGNALSNWAVPVGGVPYSPPIGSKVAVMFFGGDANNPAYMAQLHSQFIFSSNDVTGITDFDNIMSALSSPSPVVILMPGKYYIAQPIIVPDYGSLIALTRNMAEPSGNYGAGGLALGGTIIEMLPSFSGGAAVEFRGTSSQGGNQVVKGITVDGSNLPGGSTAGGLLSTGYIAGVTLRDVLLYGGGQGGIGFQATNDGTPGHNADFWDVGHVKVSGWGSTGINTVGHADTYWTDVESTGNQGDNWLIENGANSRYLGCKGENSAIGADWNFKDDSGFTGTLTFITCTSEVSTSAHGRSWQGTGTGTYIFRGCSFPNGTAYPANQTSIVSDDLPPVFDLTTGTFTGSAETIIGTFTIPANYLSNPNGQMRFHVYGRSTAGTIGDTTRIRVRANTVGGSILLDFGSITATSGNQRWAFDGTMSVDGAGSGGQVDTYAVLNATLAGSPPTLYPASTGSVNVALNSSVTFCVTVQMNDAASTAKTLGGTMILDAQV